LIFEFFNIVVIVPQRHNDFVKKHEDSFIDNSQTYPILILEQSKVKMDKQI